MSKRRNETHPKEPQSKFNEIQKKNLEILKKRIEVYSSDDDSESDSDKIDKTKIDALFVNCSEENGQAAKRIQNFFENGENDDCLICIRKIKSKDSIWSCQKCFLSYHLACIQRWANDSTIQKKISNENQPEGYYNTEGTFVPKKDVRITWDCPQCRNVYETSEIPREYLCYCGKEKNPLPQTFMIPHSCGEICNSPLDPQCGHKCLMLCHPGRHHECAQMIQKSCNCQKSAVKSIRCYQQNWSCEKKCGKLLACGIHKCEGICHAQCSPCKKSRVLSCVCGKSSKEIKCDQTSWNCQKECGKILSCGNTDHNCTTKCHSGDCSPCGYGLDRSCFCGKQKTPLLICTEINQKESCGSTCEKFLTCGNPEHKCMSRCHKGACGQCTELVVKKCRCGNITKEFSCSKELQCELKCKNMKNCKKHACNKKCCIQCLPCDKICSKPIGCGKHKCGSFCHSGNCYPCTKKTTSSCRCGKTLISVNCGPKTKIPKCKELCKIPSKCHHTSQPHHCHFGECSNCVQICSEVLACGHECLSKCHDYVKTITKDKNFVAKVPGEYAEEKIEMKKIPHPPCMTLIKVNCLGGHEEMEMECHSAKVSSCGRKCDRKLKCGNHKCKMLCHSVKNIEDDDQDEDCEDCELPCSFERPCQHPCPKGCHPKECKRCLVSIKSKCFCGLTDVFFRCCDVNKKGLTKEENDELKDKYMNCGSKCIKLFPCGHSCISNCHKGECPNAKECTRKVKLTCACKTRKLEYSCDIVRNQQLATIPCDLNCETKKNKKEEEKLMEKIRLQEIEDEKNRRELELFEKKFGPKIYKEKKVQIQDRTPTDMYKYKVLLTSCIILILAAVVYMTLF